MTRVHSGPDSRQLCLCSRFHVWQATLKLQVQQQVDRILAKIRPAFIPAGCLARALKGAPAAMAAFTISEWAGVTTLRIVSVSILAFHIFSWALPPRLKGISFQSGGQARPSFFDRRDSFGAGYTGEIFKKLRQRPPVLQIICQRLKRNPRSAKHGFTAEDSRVADNDARGHFANLLPKV